MHPPIFVRELSGAERAQLDVGLRSPSAFTVRRAQIVRLSAAGRPPRAIAQGLCCAVHGLLHQSPRAFGHARSTWTLTLLAQVAHDQGLSATVLSDETIRRALARLEVGWKRAKRWLTSPDPDYARKKVAAIA